MAFPQTALPITVELSIDSVWTDISSDVYERDAIVIRRGRSDEGEVVDAGQCSFTLNNRTGKYSPNNPRSEYYGILKRNTPVRVSVAAGSSYLSTTGATGESASTPDAAALDITGDIDIRMEVTALEHFNDATTREYAGKWLATGNQRSWILFLDEDGNLTLNWSTDGSATDSAAFDVLSFPRDGRLALRVTLDVDNGSSEHVATLYTASTIDGPWVEYDSVTDSGTTSIFAGTAPLQIGNVSSSDFLFDGLNGRVHAFRLYDGIGGSLVADPDFSTQTPGDTSFTGADGLTWTVNGDAEVSNLQIRFRGEVAAWPVRWNEADGDTYVSVEAAGIKRRLGQGQTPLLSTMRRKIPREPTVLAYWPMEDTGDATYAASGLPYGKAMKASGMDWGSASVLPGSDALPTVSSTSESRAKIYGPATVGSATAWSVEFVYFVEALTAGYETYLVIESTGTLRQWHLQMSTTGFRLVANFNEGVGLYIDGGHGWAGDLPAGQWIRMRVSCQTFGASISYSIEWFDVNDVSLDSHTNTRGSSSPGGVTAIASEPGGFSENLDGMAIGHIAVFDDFQIAYERSVSGYDGETANARLTRLCDELDIPFYLHGLPTNGALMGAQRPGRSTDLLQECADADHGILYEERSVGALAYQDRVSLYNQTVALELDYTGDTGLVTPLEPVDDDQFLRNDVTVVREGGSSTQVEVTEGSLAVASPPDGVGRYADQVTLNLFEDEQTGPHAGWLAHLGTWDEMRFPVVNIMLQKSTGMVDQVLRVDSGSRLEIAHPPDWLPPEDIDLMVQGYTELLHPFRWEFTYTCTPYGPWEVGRLEDATYSRADTGGSTLVVARDADDTSFTVLTQVDSARWIDSATYSSEFPFDLKVGGERVTATACTQGLLDGFGRTVASGWGSADIGGAYITGGGAASDFNVASGVGTHLLTTVNLSRRTSLVAPSADFDVVVDVATSALSAGGSQFACVMTRFVDSDNVYFARIEFTTAAAMVLSIRKRVSATESTVGSTFSIPLTHVAGTFYRIRFRGHGTALRAKAWLASSGEPDSWQVSTSDSSLTSAGRIGCRSILASGNTNVNPVVSYDNLVLYNPQLFTVTRSVNGIEKSHAAGAALSLADPTYVAL